MRKPLVLLLTVVAVLASACGIQPTGVVPGGPGPTLPNSARGTELVLYFVDSSGLVTPAYRPSKTVLDVNATIAILLNGPSADEADRGLSTELPSVPRSITVDDRVTPIVLSLGYPVQKLSDAGINQLVCTAATALAMTGNPSGGTQGITIVGLDAKLPARFCRAF